MNSTDPFQQAESFVRKTHDTIGATTQPVLKRYPLLFSFLIVVAAAAIFKGFEFIIQDTPILRAYPWTLVVGGLVVLIGTGSLYRWLDKNS